MDPSRPANDLAGNSLPMNLETAGTFLLMFVYSRTKTGQVELLGEPHESSSLRLK